MLGPADMALLALFARDRRAAVTAFAPRWQAWYGAGASGAAPWDRPDALDHPANKLLVGQRLALGAQDKALPMPQDAVREGAEVRVRLRGIEGGLHAWSGAAPIGFELCDAGGACRFAPARIEGDAVVLGNAGDAVQVRYAWQDSPVVNLFDGRALPAPGLALAISGR